MNRKSTLLSAGSLNHSSHGMRRRAARALFEAVEPRLLMSTYTVNTTADPTTTVAGQLSLREAIVMAQADGTADTIQFDPTVFTPGSQHVVLLTEGQIAISDSAGLTISGPGSATVAISADNSGRIFSIAAGSNVSISGVTLTGGEQFLSESNFSSPGGTNFNTVGGAISNAGSLTIQNASLSGNSVQASTYYSVNGGEPLPGFGLGGAIYSTGSLNISDSTLSSNSVVNTAQAGPDVSVAGGSSFGGAIYSSGTLVLSSDTFSGNSVTGYDGRMTFESTANGGNALGGAIYSADTGTLSLNNSTISGNTATGGDTDPTYSSGIAGNAQGAGVYIGQSAVTLSNDVITSNSAIAGSSGLDSGRSGGASGAGLYAAGTVTLNSSTVSNNTATSDSNYLASPSEGGGVFGGIGVTLQSDSIQNNTVEGGPALLGSSLPSAAGGGVFAGNYAQVIDTTIANNSITTVTSPFGEPGGEALGGGLYAGGGSGGSISSIISNSTISGNSAQGGHGYDDGIGDYLPAAGGDASGGGVYSLTALTIADSTIANNSATGGAGGDGENQNIPQNGANGGSATGGGIDAASLVVTDSTITGNTTTGGAGGEASPSMGYTNGSTGTANGGGVTASSATFSNSIISGDTAAGTPQDLNVNTTSSDAYNLVGVGGGLVNGQNGNIVGVTNPDLSVLGNYGGTTQTMVPQAGSPAIDAGSNSLVPSGTTTDQRGLPRISNGTVDIGSVEVQVAATQLTGTIIGTSGSYQNDGNTIAKAFDGNLATFYDGASANGNYLGLNLGASDIITQISYAPRSGWAGRMVGGVFQGANNASFSGATTLYTITAAPTQGVLTTVPISNSTAFQYVRYLAPANSYGNVAELDFYGTVGTTSSSKLTGTIVGTSGSYQNDGNTISKAFDGILTNYFDGPTANGDYAGLNLGSAKVITQIAYDPRTGFASRMVGGVFQGSNSSDFSNATTLYTVTSAPPSDTLTTINISNTNAFEFVRYLAPAGSYGDVGELAFYGYAPTVTQVSGTVIGTAGSYQSQGNTIAKVFDGNLSTYFDAPTGTGNWVGLDLGSAQVVTQVSYAPRAGWESRMVGGEIQASNTANFSSGVVTLATISQTPSAGVLTTQALANTTAYRYYRYIGPANSFCNIAELELFV